MSVLIVGSHALNQMGSFRKATSDLDIIAGYDDGIAYIKKRMGDSFKLSYISSNKCVAKNGNEIIELEIAWDGSSAQEILKSCRRSQTGVCYIGADNLLWLKMSHRYLRNSPHFLKTMEDIFCLRRIIPGHLRKDAPAWFKRREAETYSYGHPSLMRNKTDFFNGDGVNYVYDHDSIHEAIAQDARPIYTLFAKDGAEVQSDYNKWMQLPFSKKVLAVVEESCVLAIERSLVPHPGVHSPADAFQMALEKVCTSITSGWFREFAWENYYTCLEFDLSRNYYAKFERAVNEKRVKFHTV